MRSSPPLTAPAERAEFARFADYRELLKPGIASFVVVMAAASYLLGSEGVIVWKTLIGLMIGTGLTAGGAGTLNHVVERDLDAKMGRTRQRPVSAGRISPLAGVLYGLGCALVGAVVLALTTNLITTVLAVLTVALYVLVYTPLKQRTVHNTIVGAVPGALPALGGVTAATGSLSTTGWVLFGILFLWQLPHFYALAWMLREDYQKGGFKMLPSAKGGVRATTTIALVSTLALLVVGMLPGATGAAGMLYLAGMAIIGVAFTIPAFSFYSEPNDERARRLFLTSVLWVPIFFALVVADVLLRW